MSVGYIDDLERKIHKAHEDLRRELERLYPIGRTAVSTRGGGVARVEILDHSLLGPSKRLYVRNIDTGTEYWLSYTWLHL